MSKGEYCEYCGALNPHGSQFCQNCGESLAIPNDYSSSKPNYESQSIPPYNQSQPYNQSESYNQSGSYNPRGPYNQSGPYTQGPYHEAQYQRPMHQKRYSSQQYKQASPKNRTVALLLLIFLGLVGGHQFYAERIVNGIIYIVLLVITGGVANAIWMVIDLILILSGNFKDNKRRPIVTW